MVVVVKEEEEGVLELIDRQLGVARGDGSFDGGSGRKEEASEQESLRGNRASRSDDTERERLIVVKKLKNRKDS